MGAAIGSLGVLLNDFLEAREEENLLRKVEKYERLQELMVKRLEFFQRYVQQVEKNLSIAEEVIAKYKNEAIPSWEEGVKGLGNQITQLQTEKAAAEQQLASLKLELAKSKDQVEDLQGLYQASLRMAQDLKQGGEEAQAKASAAESQNAKLQKSLDTYRAWHAANLSLRCALEMQLLRADPENPLLHDQALRERVRRAGEMAVTMLGDNPDVDPFDMAREAGLTFDVPGRPSGVQVLSELALTEVYMRRLAFLHAEGEDAWKALHKVQIGHGAMTAARDLLQQMEPQSALLQASTVQQVQDLAMEEFQRQQQQRRLTQKGPSAAWSAAVAGQQTVRQRAVEDLEYLIEEDPIEANHAP